MPCGKQHLHARCSSSTCLAFLLRVPIVMEGGSGGVALAGGVLPEADDATDADGAATDSASSEAPSGGVPALEEPPSAESRILIKLRFVSPSLRDKPSHPR